MIYNKISKLTLIAAFILIISSIYYYQQDTIDINKPEGVINTANIEELAEVGYRSPNFLLTSLDNIDYSIDKLKGKVIFLNIWATWCVPCKIEMPSMEKLYAKLKHKDFEMLAVSIDKNNDADVADYVKTLGLSFPVLIDKNNTITKNYDITTIPKTYIIDKSGIIVSKIRGARDWNSPKSQEALLYLIEDRQRIN